MWQKAGFHVVNRCYTKKLSRIIFMRLKQILMVTNTFLTSTSPIQTLEHPASGALSCTWKMSGAMKSKPSLGKSDSLLCGCVYRSPTKDREDTKRTTNDVSKALRDGTQLGKPTLICGEFNYQEIDLESEYVKVARESGRRCANIEKYYYISCALTSECHNSIKGLFMYQTGLREIKSGGKFWTSYLRF